MRERVIFLRSLINESRALYIREYIPYPLCGVSFHTCRVPGV